MSRNFFEALVLIHGGMLALPSWINTLFPFKAASPFLPFKQDEWFGRRRISVLYMYLATPPKILPPRVAGGNFCSANSRVAVRRMLSHFPCPFITNTHWRRWTGPRVKKINQTRQLKVT